MRRRLCLLLAVLLVGGVWLPITSRTITAQEDEGTPASSLDNPSLPGSGNAVSGNTYTSDVFGYSITWDNTWTPVEGSSGDGYDVLHLATQQADFYLEAYTAYGGDPDVCVATKLDKYQANTTVSNLSVVDQQPAPTDGSTPVASATVTLTIPAQDGSPLDLAATVICQTLLPGAAVIIVTFVAHADVYETLAPAADALIANVVLPPSATPLDLTTFLPEVQADIDAFWTAVFEAGGLTYTAPSVVNFDGPVQTGCGTTEPFAIGPFYCTLDSTIYFDLPLMEQEIVPLGNLVVAFTAAHETGHHIEALIGITKCGDAACTTGIPSAYYELLADCFAGTWVRSAADRGLDVTGDLEETIVALASFFGDKGEIASDTLGDPLTAHGPGSQRTWWFLKGYFESIDGCLTADEGALDATPVP